MALNYLLVLVLGVIRQLGQAEQSAPLDFPTAGGLSALCLGLGSWVVLRVYAPSSPLRSALGLRATHWGLVGLGAGLGLCLKWPTDALLYSIESSDSMPAVERLAREQLFPAQGVLPWAVFIAVSCGIAPFFEELFFRGALFGQLIKKSLLEALLVPAALFIVAHTSVRSWPGLTVVALVLGYLRYQSGSSIPPMAFHASFNAASVAQYHWLTPGDSRSPSLQVILVSLLAAMASVVAIQFLGTTSSARLARAKDAV